MILYNEEAELVYEKRSPKEEFNLVFKGGRTSYKNAFLIADQVLKRNDHTSHKPVLFFLTDGENDTGNEEIQHITDSYFKFGLETFIIGFRVTEDDVPVLLYLAELSFGNYITTGDLSSIKLEEAFQEMSHLLNN